MGEPIEIEEGEVSLKQFLKYHPANIHITPQLNQYSAWHEEYIRVKGQYQNVSMHYHTTIKTDIESSNYPYTEVPQKIALSGFDVETLLTLLAHKPDRIVIEYWKENDSQWLTKRNLHQETIIFKGLKHNKKGLVSKTYSVSISHTYDHTTPQYCLNAIESETK